MLSSDPDKPIDYQLFVGLWASIICGAAVFVGFGFTHHVFVHNDALALPLALVSLFHGLILFRILERERNK